MIPSLTNTVKANLLVVDDTPANLHLLAGLLREQSYVVRAALNGELALKAVAQQQPDLILLDIKMPVLVWSSPFFLFFLLVINGQVRSCMTCENSGLNLNKHKVNCTTSDHSESARRNCD